MMAPSSDDGPCLASSMRCLLDGSLAVRNRDAKLNTVWVILEELEDKRRQDEDRQLLANWDAGREEEPRLDDRSTASRGHIVPATLGSVDTSGPVEMKADWTGWDGNERIGHGLEPSSLLVTVTESEADSPGTRREDAEETVPPSARRGTTEEAHSDVEGRLRKVHRPGTL